MKRLWLASFLIPLLLTPPVPRAQCGGTCPSGALTTLPSGTPVTLPASPPYCIAGSVVNKTTSYVIDGTLIAQGGHHRCGNARPAYAYFCNPHRQLRKACPA